MVTEKASPSQAADRSVIERPLATATPSSGGASDILWYVADAASDIIPWGKQPKARDRQLRGFVPTESYFASALGSVCARNAGFSWELTGPPRLTARMQDVLENANLGEGWHDFITKLSFDLYTQDSAAFMEIVRDRDSPDGVVIGINHLDAARCWHTGSPEAPVLYQDRKNRYHLLKWYQVVTLPEMPTPIEHFYGMQMCALTRMLKAAEIIKNVTQYKMEKTGGRFNKAIHLIAGITQQQMDDALKAQTMDADMQGLFRYVQPIITASVDPKATIDVKTLELASLPDGWDEEITWKHYISIIAMAFLSDFQDFAPLPGGGLGTSAQSQVLHMKSRGKGPALFQKLISHALNFRVFPKAVEFSWAEQDIEAEQMEAEVKMTRAQTYKLYFETNILPEPQLRQLALDNGDISQEIFDSLGMPDTTPDQTTPDDEHVDTTPSDAPSSPPPPPQAAVENPPASKEADWWGEPNVSIVIPSQRVRRNIERDEQGRIAAITEEYEDGDAA